MTGDARDPIDVASEWVEVALLGQPWEARDSDGQEPCFIERGTDAAGDGERFIEAELSYLDACIVERLLEVARASQDAGTQSAVRVIRSLGFIGNAHYCPDCMNHFHADHGQHQPDCSIFAEWRAEDEEGGGWE